MTSYAYANIYGSLQPIGLSAERAKAFNESYQERMASRIAEDERVEKEKKAKKEAAKKEKELTKQAKKEGKQRKRGRAALVVEPSPCPSPLPSDETEEQGEAPLKEDVEKEDLERKESEVSVPALQTHGDARYYKDNGLGQDDVVSIKEKRRSRSRSLLDLFKNRRSSEVVR
jgi:hypothetical protein